MPERTAGHRIVLRGWTWIARTMMAQQERSRLRQSTFDRTAPSCRRERFPFSTHSCPEEYLLVGEKMNQPAFIALKRLPTIHHHQKRLRPTTFEFTGLADQHE